MANVKISQLPSLTTMTGVAQIPVVAGGVTYQITGANLQNYFVGTYGNANVVANLAALGSNPILTTGNITGGNLDAVNLVINSISSDDSSFVTIEDGVNVNGTISATGNITGNYFIGNGSLLTGISNTGNVTFSGEIVIGTGTSNLISGLYLAPSSSSANANMYLRVRGNITDEPTHIHFDTGNNAYYNQFIGDDNKYIQLANTGNIIINSNDGGGNSAQWIFAAADKITLPNGASLNDTSGDSVAFGQNAGLTSQAQHAVAIGINAGSLYQGEDSIAIGYNAGYRDQQRGVAIGWNAGQGGTLTRSVSDAQGGSGPVHNYVSGNGNPTLTLDSVVDVNVNDKVFGNNIPAGAYVASINDPAIDISAPPTAALTAGDDITFVGLTLGLNDASNVVVGMRVTGTDIPANIFVQSTGCSVVTLNQYPTAPLIDNASIVFSVGQGFGATAVGYQSGSTFQGDDAVAVGRQAGYTSQNERSVAVGGLAGYNVQGANAVAVGYNAGQGTQGINAVAVGYNAGYDTQGAGAVAIGEDAGFLAQGEGAVAIGFDAGGNAQGIVSVAIGTLAGNNSQGNAAVAVGYNTGITAQGAGAVAVGASAGYGYQGLCAVAIGTDSGSSNQSANAIAIGTNAGFSNQGSIAVAIGSYAGNTAQGNAAVAVGASAGYGYQGNSAVAVGEQAGVTSQGNFAVAIGASAGTTSQGNNSIIINATGAALEQTTANTFTVKPVRGDSTANLVGGGFKAVYYNSSTGEFAYSTD